MMLKEYARTCIDYERVSVYTKTIGEIGATHMKSVFRGHAIRRGDQRLRYNLSEEKYMVSYYLLLQPYAWYGDTHPPNTPRLNGGSQRFLDRNRLTSSVSTSSDVEMRSCSTCLISSIVIVEK